MCECTTTFVMQKPIREEWNSGVEALNDALNLEAQVTRSIREIIATCENPKTYPFNDYHVSRRIHLEISRIVRAASKIISDLTLR